MIMPEDWTGNILKRVESLEKEVTMLNDKLTACVTVLAKIPGSVQAEELLTCILACRVRDQEEEV